MFLCHQQLPFSTLHCCDITINNYFVSLMAEQVAEHYTAGPGQAVRLSMVSSCRLTCIDCIPYVTFARPSSHNTSVELDRLLSRILYTSNICLFTWTYYVRALHILSSSDDRILRESFWCPDARSLHSSWGRVPGSSPWAHGRYLRLHQTVFYEDRWSGRGETTRYTYMHVKGTTSSYGQTFAPIHVTLRLQSWNRLW